MVKHLGSYPRARRRRVRRLTGRARTCARALRRLRRHPHRRRRHHRPGHRCRALASAATTTTSCSRPTREIGGYCKTVKKDGFVWDYSGHFFHFKHPEIELAARAHARAAHPRRREEVVHRVQGRAAIDFPFQKNIHQLPQDEFIDCLHDLYFARSSDVTRAEPAPEANFKEMLHARFGRSICEKFLIPYNEKLYACDLATLDKDAMGRFFPHADLTDIVRNMKRAGQRELQRDVHVPRGRRHRVRASALASAVRAGRHRARRGARRGRPRSARSRARRRAREIRFERLVSSAPFNRFAAICGLAHDAAVWRGTRCSSSTWASTARAARRPLGVLPVARHVVLPRRLLRQHLRHRPHEPLRRARLSQATRAIDVDGDARARCSPISARGRRHRPAARRRALGRDGSGVRPHHAALARRARAPRRASCTARRLVASVATAAGPTARSRTTSSRRARSSRASAARMRRATQ